MNSFTPIATSRSVLFLFVLICSIPIKADELFHFRSRYALSFSGERLHNISDRILGSKNKQIQSLKDFQDFIIESVGVTNSLGIESNLQLEQFVQGHEFERLLTEFDSSLLQAGLVDSILCRPYEKMYYWKRSLGKEVLQLLIGQILKYVPYANLLDPLRVILNYYHDLKQEQIKYHSNVLRYYLMSFPAVKLGLQEEDKNTCLASIHDLQMGTFNMIELFQLNKYWESYPQREYGKQLKKMNKRQKRWRKYFSQEGEKLGPYHQTMINKKSRQIIVDWEEPIYLFFKKPSIIHFSHKPAYVRLKRTAYRLLELGAKILPVPVLGSVVSFLTKQNYSNQVQNEAFLLGYFESIGNEEFSQHLAGQTGNPLINHSLGDK
jgi:hypothetical protein